MKKEQKLPEQLNAKKSNFPEWMSQVLALTKIIDNRYNIKSMFVWMPYGYDMMLRIKACWDKLFKEEGIKEMYFPLMVPVEYAEQNDLWWKGFKEEGFWAGSRNKQEFILRPTGEPAMYPMFSLWIRGYNDLPLRIYETVFSYRYETKQTRPLIRDREIGPWYEIHTVHATREEAEKEIDLARKMNDKVWDFIAIKPLLVRNIRTAIDRYYKRAGISGAKVNDLRHTWVAHHLSSGASLVLISKIAGHKRLSTTERYLPLIQIPKGEEKLKLEQL